MTGKKLHVIPFIKTCQKESLNNCGLSKLFSLEENMSLWNICPGTCRQVSNRDYSPEI